MGWDLNFNTDSRQYKELCELLEDKTNTLGESAYFDDFFKQIDFIFTNTGKIFNSTINTYEWFMSDHPGIELTINL